MNLAEMHRACIVAFLQTHAALLRQSGLDAEAELVQWLAEQISARADLAAVT